MCMYDLPLCVCAVSWCHVTWVALQWCQRDPGDHPGTQTDQGGRGRWCQPLLVWNPSSSWEGSGSSRLARVEGGGTHLEIGPPPLCPWGEGSRGEDPSHPWRTAVEGRWVIGLLHVLWGWRDRGGRRTHTRWLALHIEPLWGRRVHLLWEDDRESLRREGGREGGRGGGEEGGRIWNTGYITQRIWTLYHYVWGHSH